MSNDKNLVVLPKASWMLDKTVPRSRLILFRMASDTLALIKERNSVSSAYQIGVFEFDSEILKIAVELANLYVKGGVTTFDQFAKAVKNDMPDIWKPIKIYLRCVWNTISDANNLKEVSRIEVADILSALDE